MGPTRPIVIFIVLTTGLCPFICSVEADVRTHDHQVSSSQVAHHACPGSHHRHDSEGRPAACDAHVCACVPVPVQTQSVNLVTVAPWFGPIALELGPTQAPVSPLSSEPSGFGAPRDPSLAARVLPLLI